jgi:hypothetical protein
MAGDAPRGNEDGYAEPEEHADEQREREGEKADETCETGAGSKVIGQRDAPDHAGQEQEEKEQELTNERRRGHEMVAGVLTVAAVAAATPNVWHQRRA